MTRLSRTTLSFATLMGIVALRVAAQDQPSPFSSEISCHGALSPSQKEGGEETATMPGIVLVAKSKSPPSGIYVFTEKAAYFSALPREASIISESHRFYYLSIELPERKNPLFVAYSFFHYGRPDTTVTLSASDHKQRSLEEKYTKVRPMETPIEESRQVLQDEITRLMGMRFQSFEDKRDRHEFEKIGLKKAFSEPLDPEPYVHPLEDCRKVPGLEAVAARELSKFAPVTRALASEANSETKTP